MIGTISGALRHKGLNQLIIDVGGVGYKVYTTADTALETPLGEPVFLWTHLSVRENALDLFGFVEREGLELFELLIGISGIGPKTALSILNTASPAMLRQAVAADDTSYLTKVAGIGKKNAEKIVLELRDKLALSGSDTAGRRAGRQAADVMEALLALGYGEREAREAVKQLPPSSGASAAERVRQALKLLSEDHAR